MVVRGLGSGETACKKLRHVLYGPVQILYLYDSTGFYCYTGSTRFQFISSEYWTIGFYGCVYILRSTF